MPLTHINPTTPHKNPAFSQGVLVTGGSMLIIGGQHGTNERGELVSTDIGEQTKQALRNVLTVLNEVGAHASHVARPGIYLAAGADASTGYASAFEVWGANPAAVTVLTVHSFARPGVLVEIEELAVVPENAS